MKCLKRAVARTIAVVGCVVLFSQALTAATFLVTAAGDNTGSPVAVALPPGVETTQIAAGPSAAAANTCSPEIAVYTWSGLGTATSTATTPTKVILPPEVWSIMEVAVGNGHFLARTDHGVFAWGLNTYGQLGDGTTTNQPTPVLVQFPPAVVSVSAIAAGYFHSLAITNDGLYAWGHNTQGDLGDGTLINSSLPIKVNLPATVSTINSIAAGDMDSFAVTNDGLYAWGYNFFGQLGDGTTVDRSTPVKVSIQTIPKKLAVVINSVTLGDHYTLANTTDGVYAWGENLRGSLGTKKLASSITPVKIAFPKVVTQVMSLGAGRIHSFAITNDGVYAWGDNSVGQLGLGAFTVDSFVLTPTKVPGEDTALAVAAGEYQSFFLH